MVQYIRVPENQPLCCGLYFVIPDEPQSKAYCSLQKVKVSANVVDLVSEVTVCQTFYNPSESVVDGTYVFPLDEKSAVCEFQAEIDGRVVKGIVKEKDEAKKEYDSAKSEGKAAYLLSQNKADVFEISVGNLPPHTLVDIKISYLTELKLDFGDVRFLLPTHVAPRYTPSGEEHVPATNKTSERGLEVNVNFQMQSKITKVSSPSHAIKADVEQEEQLTAKVTLINQSSELDKDVIFHVTTEKTSEARVCLETHEKSRALMISFVPEFELDDEKCELVFVIDRSGSMSGQRIEQAGQAMQLFLRSLPMDCYFNIVGFGSSYKKLFPSSVKLGRETLQTASEHAKTLSADLGGTQLFEPLDSIYSSPKIPEYARQVFVLTDGQISNTENVLKLVQKNTNDADGSRTFALGIGSGVSHHLVEGIARNGKGTSDFVTNAERLEKTVIQQLQHATQPALKNVRIEWDGSQAACKREELPEKKSKKSLLGFIKPKQTERKPLMQTPYNTPPIFHETKFLSYILLRPDEKTPKSINIIAKSPEGDLTLELPITDENTYEGDLIHKMTARSLIRDLEEETSYMHLNKDYFSSSDDDIKKEIIRLGVSFSLLSKHTSFVAIDHQSKKEIAQLKPHRIEKSKETIRDTSMNMRRKSKSKTSSSSTCDKRAKTKKMLTKSAVASPSLQKSMAPPQQRCSVAPTTPQCAAAPAPQRCSSSLLQSASLSPRAGPAPAPAASVLPQKIPRRKNKEQELFKEEEEKRACKEEKRACKEEKRACKEEILACEEEKRSCEERERDSEKKLKQEQQKQSRAEKTYGTSEKTKLLLLQEFDGSFPSVSGLAALLEVSSDQLNEHRPSDADESVWTTALAVIFMKLKLKDYLEELRMVVGKAEKYLKMKKGTDFLVLADKTITSL